MRSTFPQILLGDYLAAKGEVKALTQAECSIFNLPVPLKRGWPEAYRDRVLTPEMLHSVAAYVAGRHTPAARRIRSALTTFGVQVIAAVKPEPERTADLANTSQKTANQNTLSHSTRTLDLFDTPGPGYQATVDYLRDLLARAECGAVAGVTVIERLASGERRLWDGE